MKNKQQIEKVYPLAPMQEGILFHAQRGKETDLYFRQAVFSITGHIDPLLLEKSFNKLIERYEVLRTAFVYKELEKPRQVVLKNRQLSIYFRDITALTQTEKEIYLEEFKEKDRAKGFDLTREMLTRAALFRTGKRLYTLIWSLHHILMDGWCLGIIYKDLVRIYESLKRNVSLELEPTTPYKKYIDWVGQQDKEEGLNYWREYLVNYRQTSTIPMLRKKLPGNGYKTEECRLVIDEKLTNHLMKIAVENHLTMNTLFQTAWGILLQKYNNTDDVVFGTIVSGRPTGIPGLDRTIGLFINTIPLRVQLNGASRFSQLAQEVQQAALMSKSYEYLPLADIQTNSELKGNLIDQIMGFENYPVQKEIKHSGGKQDFDFTIENMTMEEQSNYDFNIGVIPGTEITIRMAYNSRVYEKNFVEEISLRFKEVLKKIIENPGIDVRSLEILSKKERKQLLFDLNNTITDYNKDKTIHQLFEARVRKNPDAAAVVYESKQVTFKELNKQINQLARMLVKKGVGPDSIVGLLLDRSIEMVTAILAILKAGGAYLPLEPGVPADRIVSMLNDSGVSVLLTKSGIVENYSFTTLESLERLNIIPQATAPRLPITDMDILPIPDRSLVNYQKYHKHIGLAPVKHTVSLQCTRGCPYQCAYCHKIWPKKQVARSAEHIFAEIKKCYDAGVRRFAFVDDIFNLKIKNSTRLLEMIIRNNMDLQLFFPNGVRGDILTEEFIDLMMKAGTVDVLMALETASPRMQKLVKKNMMLDRFEKNLQYIIKHYPYVNLEMNIMIGFPTETEEEALAALEFLKRQKWIHFPNMHLLKIYPNTDMYRLALENGIPEECIKQSIKLGYHELPETLPFSKGFARKYQTKFLNEYFLLKERLLYVLPYQMKIFSRDELVQKYDSYLPVKIRSFSDLLEFCKISGEELGGVEFFQDEQMAAPNFRENFRKYYPPQKKDDDALRILFLDLSLLFSRESEDELYSVVEPPLGLMYLLTHLNEKFQHRVRGKVIKSQVDFDAFEELKEILDEFRPELLCVRTLSYYKDFFHTTLSLIRQWGFDMPIFTGGPYATSDYPTVLQDKNVDVVVLGEGELTLAELVEKMLANNKKLPGQEELQQVRGIAYVKDMDKPLLARGGREILQLDRLAERIGRYPGENFENINRSTDLCYVIFTSGSTGKPKGTLTSHKNVIRVVKNTNYIDLNEGDRVLQLSNYAFDGSVFDIYGALLNGAPLVLIKKEDVLAIDRLSRLIARQGINVFFVTTALFNTLVDLDIQSLTGIKQVLFGGERVSVEHTRKALDYLGKGRILHMYGPTETTVYATCHVVNQVDDRLGAIPIGKPLSNTFVYILARNIRPVPAGVLGEVYIGGDGVSRGYLNNPELTGEKFLENPFVRGDRMYRTGDLARWLPQGDIEFLERIDRQVKIRGYRIELGEIESCLISHKEIKEAVVVVFRAGDLDGKSQGSCLCAYVVPGRPFETSELREYLSRQLPAYMIPAYFVQLDSLPLTPVGKIDKKALPKPESAARGDNKLPRNEIEEKLAKVWKEVLAVENLGINDNFFEIGGDSIKVIQVSARLNRHGLEVNTADLFANPTIEELGKYVKKTKRVAHQELVTGTVELTPIQRWFFDNDFTDIHHFNQSVMLYKEDGFKEEFLRIVVRKLVEHHDALRMVYNIQEQEVHQINRDLKGDLFHLETFDLTTEKDVEKQIVKECSRIQKGIRLDSGPLVKLGLFKTGNGDHLLIVIHHSVIDGVSWRIFFEDFESGYKQLEQGKVVELPLKTDSFKTWAHRLKTYSQSRKALRELEYWKKQGADSLRLKPLPKDYQISEEKKKRKYIKYIAMNLNEEETRLLLRKVNRAYNTEINDILLTALGIALKEWTQQDKVLITLEGHGRENIIDGVDISRTIGWFTSLYPVLLDMSEEDLSYQIISVKEYFRRVPNRGIGFAILKYLVPGSQKDEKDRLILPIEPEISFNYLGQFEQVGAGRFAGISRLGRGDDISGEFQQVYSIEVNGMLVEGKLGLSFSYNPHEYQPQRIEALVENYKRHLIKIIKHCSQKKDKEKTPSDYGCANMSITDIKRTADYISTHVGDSLKIQDIYRLTPMQAGMLYHWLRTKNSTAYFEQFELTLKGELDKSLLEESFNKLVARYDILRTIFVYEKLAEPMQVVLTQRQTPVHYEDISHLSAEEKRQYLETFKKSDRTKGFDLTKDLLLRNSLFKTGADSHTLVWSIHHILMDGWCVGIIYNELTQIYQALKKQVPLQLESAAPYRRYIQWLEKQDKTEGLAYWQEYLNGYEKQAVLPQSRENENGKFELEEYSFTLDKDVTGKLKQLARENQVTENTIFRAIWAILLQLYNNTDDVVFGAVVSGRPPEIEAIENMVGLFINTIPVRVKIERSDDFLELLHQVHRSAVRSKPYEYVPLADIQARSSLKGNLIDHIIAFENYPLHEEMKKAGGEQGPGFTIESLEAADHTNYNFHICIGPGERFRVRVCFNAVIYNRRFIEKVVTHFQEVIRQVTAHDAVPLEDIKITHDYVSAGADMLLEDQEDWLLE